MKTTHALLCFCGLVPSCKQSSAGGAGIACKVDTVTFVAVAPAPPATAPQPDIHIDTKMKLSGRFGGTFKTSAPCSITDDGTRTPFAIKHKYDVVRDKSTRPWREVMSDC